MRATKEDPKPSPYEAGRKRIRDDRLELRYRVVTFENGRLF